MSPPSRALVTSTIILLIGAAIAGYLITTIEEWSLAVAAVILVAAAAVYRPQWGLAVLVLLLPFTAIEGSAEAGGYGKVIQDFKKVAAVGVLMAWGLRLLLRRRSIDLPLSAALPLGVLGVAAGFSALRAPEPDVAFTSSARLLLYIGVYVVMLIDLTQDADDVWRLIKVQFLSASIAAGFAIYQFVAHFAGWPTFLNPIYETDYVLPRVHSFMQEPLWFSNFLLTVIPASAALYTWRAGRWPWSAGTTAGLTSTALILAASRLGWACGALGAVLFLAVALKYMRPQRLLVVVAVGIVALTAAGSMWARKFGSAEEMGRYVADFATFASPEGGRGDLEGHLRMLPLIAEGLRTTPLIGVGTNNVGFRFHQEMGLEQPRISTTHNTYLDIFLETGGLGLLGFLGLLLVSLTVGLRRAVICGAQAEGALMFGLVIGVLTMAVHLSNWSGWREAHVWYAFGMTIAAARAFGHSPERPETQSLGDTGGLDRWRPPRSRSEALQQR
jgi:hypothetical protein